MSGRLFGVGVGPGDPELLTVKAQRIVAAVDVIAYPNARHGRSVARAIAAPHFRGDQIEVALEYPVTTEQTDHPGGYEAALSEFYDAAAAQLAVHLDAGRDVAVLCEGDPFFYGSYMYLHERLADRYATEVVPGVTSFSAAAAAAGTPLVRRDDILTVLPGTLPPDVLAARLRAGDAAVVIKLGRTFPGVADAARRAGVTDRAIYVERASSDAERIAPLADAGDRVPYMSLVLVPSSVPAPRNGRPGSVSVVGLGPAGPDWLTPEAQRGAGGRRRADRLRDVPRARARAARAAPPRDRQPRRGASARATPSSWRPAARAWRSSRRATRASSRWPPPCSRSSTATWRCADVEVRIVPGLSAMQAAAARVGAPLGHDFCVVSLSDQLKPWDVVERRLDAAGAADLVLALYNPASRTRREQLDARRRGAAAPSRRRDAGRRRARGRRAGGVGLGHDARRRWTSTSSTCARCSSSARRRRARSQGEPPRVYTPRRYPA